MESRGLVPYSSEYFEPVRDGGFTVQGFAGIFEKAGFDLGRQQVMCFRKWVGLVGDYFLANRTLLFKKGIVSDENMKISAFCTHTGYGFIPYFPLTHVGFPFPSQPR